MEELTEIASITEAESREIWLAATFFIVAAVAGLGFRVGNLRDRPYLHLLGLCFVSGFLGITGIALLSWFNPLITVRLWPGLGVASFLGLFGKEIAELIRLNFRKLFLFGLKKFGIDLTDFENEQSEDEDS
ncbi:MAG: hypothetical protein AAFV88_11660 [Planctomycetota bacterium]